jgi:hypothetical protein
MARATLARDAGKLGLGNAGLSALDGPVDRHCYPFVEVARGRPYEAIPNSRA